MKMYAISQGVKVGIEWAQSIKRRPLEKGVARYVTIATDELTETLGKTADGVVSLRRTAANGAKEYTVMNIGEKQMYRALRFVDGSECETRYLNGIPRRTDGHFFVTTKDGEKLRIGYGVAGFTPPSVHKEIFIKNLNRLGDPKYEVNLSEIFPDNTPKLKKLLKRIFSPILYLIEKNNKKNTELRKFANSIDKNA